MNANAFGQTDEPDFDLTAWLTGARLPERSVTVYGRADLVAEYAELEEQLRAPSQATVQDDRLTGSPESKIAQRMTEVREQMRSSALTIRLRALLKAERLEITEGAPLDSDGDPESDYVAAHWIAKAAIRPTMTPEQVDMMRAKIGEGQFAGVWDTAWAVTNDKRVTVPLSLAHSAALSTPDSSQS